MLLEEFYDAGLIQFGVFENSHGEHVESVRFRLGMLPSYPNLFQTLCQQISDLIQPEMYDYLVVQLGLYSTWWGS